VKNCAPAGGALGENSVGASRAGSVVYEDLNPWTSGAGVRVLECAVGEREARRRLNGMRAQCR